MYIWTNISAMYMHSLIFFLRFLFSFCTCSLLWSFKNVEVCVMKYWRSVAVMYGYDIYMLIMLAVGKKFLTVLCKIPNASLNVDVAGLPPDTLSGHRERFLQCYRRYSQYKFFFNNLSWQLDVLHLGLVRWSCFSDQILSFFLFYILEESWECTLSCYHSWLFVSCCTVLQAEGVLSQVWQFAVL